MNETRKTYFVISKRYEYYKCMQDDNYQTKEVITLIGIG